MLYKKLLKIILIGFICLLCFCLRAPFFPEPLSYDEGVFSYFAMQINSGDGFYSTFWGTKPPGVGLIYAMVYVLFNNSVVALRIFSSIIGVISTLLLYKLAKLLFNSKVGIFSALVFAVCSSSVVIEGNRAYTELFMVFFTIGACYLFFLALNKKNYLLLGSSGLLLGLSFMTKQVAAFDFFCFLCFNFILGFTQFRRRTFRSMFKPNLILILAFAIPLLSFTLYFYFTERLHDFYYWSFLKSLTYIRSSRIKNITGWPRANLSYVFKKMFLFWLLSWGGILYNLFFKRSLKRFFLILWYVFAALGVSLGGWFFHHYFIQILPPACILVGLFTSDIIRETKKMRITRFHWLRKGLITSIIVILLGQSSILNWRYLPGYIGYLQGKLHRREYLKKCSLPTWEDRIDAGQYLTKTMGTEETLFVWDSTPVVYFLTNKKPITRYSNSRPLLEEKLLLPTSKGLFSNFAGHRRQLMIDLRTNVPDYIIIRAEPEKIFDEMFLVKDFCGFVHQNYDFLKSFNHVLIFKSKDGIKKVTDLERERSSIPLEIIKRFAAITQIITNGEETTITFEPMVNPNGIIRTFKSVYDKESLEQINFQPLPVQFIEMDKDKVHIQVKGLSQPIAFARVKREGDRYHYCNRSYGVNPPLEVVQTGKTTDLYSSPPPGESKGKTFNVYFIYEDGTISSAEVKNL